MKRCSRSELLAQLLSSGFPQLRAEASQLRNPLVALAPDCIVVVRGHGARCRALRSLRIWARLFSSAVAAVSTVVVFGTWRAVGAMVDHVMISYPLSLCLVDFLGCAMHCVIDFHDGARSSMLLLASKDCTSLLYHERHS